MFSILRIFLAAIAGVTLLTLTVYVASNKVPMSETLIFSSQAPAPTIESSSSPIVVSNVAAGFTPPETTTSTPKKPRIRKSTSSQKNASTKTTTTTSTSSNDITRIQNPYPFAPKTVEEVNANTRAALVNILCDTSGSTLQPISGSGVVIDPRGIILTNAHVGQYVLLSTRPELQLSCLIRTGSPAVPHWRAQMLYIPSIWVKEHVREITQSHPQGTGENDYALLFVTGSVDEQTLPQKFPYLPFDTRDAVGFVGDPILVAGYPAEFVGGIATRMGLYASSAATAVKEILTFVDRTVDLLSLGSTVVAQGGSSGGAVANQWGQLIGLVVTTSEGTTTASRDLRAITIAHIDRSLRTNFGTGLKELLAGDPAALSAQFATEQGPELSQLLMDRIPKRQ